MTMRAMVPPVATMTPEKRVDFNRALAQHA
jgi:hypothetical protein